MQRRSRWWGRISVSICVSISVFLALLDGSAAAGGSRAAHGRSSARRSAPHLRSGVNANARIAPRKYTRPHARGLDKYRQFLGREFTSHIGRIKPGEVWIDSGGGLGVAALGTAVSSVGWVLYGQDQISQGVTLPLGVGGLLVGLAGVLFVTHSIQRPLEPFTAPTPEHRLTRQEARELVAIVNRRLHIDICAAAKKAEAP
jgi:hypothetical protein